MKSFLDISNIVNSFHNQGETIKAAHFLLDEYILNHPNLKGFELREAATPDFILFTTEGDFGAPQIIRIPKNTFEFPLDLMLTLLAHEMIHVDQKQTGSIVLDKNEREWQAYYEMIFHNIYFRIPDVSLAQKQLFANKALAYYNRMGEGSELQHKYNLQKIKIDNLLVQV